MVDVWHEKVEVRFGSVDRSDRLTLGSIFNFFQEAAISHASDLGVGRDVLERVGQAWILLRFSLFVQRRPVCGEIVRVSTWPRSYEKLLALRDYEIRDAQDNVVVRGRGGWLILDINKRRPVRTETFVEPLPVNDGIDAFSGIQGSRSPTALKQRENLAKKTERTALYSDIDYYGHANNARYIQWIQDATDTDILTASDQIRLDINYLHEVLPGDTVELWTAALAETVSRDQVLSPADYPSPFGHGFVYEGRRPGTDQALFRAELCTNV